LHGGGFSDCGGFFCRCHIRPSSAAGSWEHKNWNAVNYGRFDMGAFWNPHGGVVLNNKKLSKNEVAHLKREWLAQLHISGSPVVKWWKKFKMVIILFLPLK
jgi:hypothetical protein